MIEDITFLSEKINDWLKLNSPEYFFFAGDMSNALLIYFLNSNDALKFKLAWL